MRVSRRRFIRMLAVAPAVAWIPVAEAASGRGHSVADVIRYLCDDVFALPAERAMRMAMREGHRIVVWHGR